MPSLPRTRTLVPVALLAIASLVLTVTFWNTGSVLVPPTVSTTTSADAPTQTERRVAKAERKKARTEYFQRLLRDPATGDIPEGVRRAELEHARLLAAAAQANPLAKRSALEYDWTEAGPNDVGGRTRAIAVDVANPQNVIAAGVAGGFWKSTDGGDTWRQTSPPDDQAAVTSIAQDPRPGFTDRWYATTGEISGSGFDAGFRASYLGRGFYRSLDGGESWQRIQEAGNPNSWDTQYDRASRVVVNPVTGTVMIAVNAFGLFRSTDGGASFSLVLGAVNEHVWSDVATGSDGSYFAALGDPFSGSTATRTPGFYRSTDDGVTWSGPWIVPGQPELSPPSFSRTVVAVAPSNPEIAYAMTFTGEGQGAEEDVWMTRLDFDAETLTNLSDSLPEAEDRSGGLNTQSAYNMALAVKPDDPSFVVFGGTNLYRSTDGFATAVTNTPTHYMGGYADPSTFAKYDNHHPDQHGLFFLPTDPTRMWSAHDGGLSLATVTDETIVWADRNQGYNVTQFYTVAQPRDAGDTRVLGGTQDNGTPYFRSDDAAFSNDVSSGDGSYAYMGADFTFVSTQNGRIRRRSYDEEGNPFPFEGFAYPEEAEGQLFIHPFSVDPDNERIVYYPVGRSIWRNTTADAGFSPTTFFVPGWERTWPNLGNIGEMISAITATSGHRVYVGFSTDTRVPSLIRIDGADGDTATFTDLPLPGAAAGGYIHHIGVNPNDTDEVVAVLSNYAVDGIFYSDDAGASWTNIEGNLGDFGSNVGPSIRTAAIAPDGDDTSIFVGTSTGLYSTAVLAGSSTVWTQESAEGIGTVIVSGLDVRPSDGRLLAATHGRGIWEGMPRGIVADESAPNLAGFAVTPPYPNPASASTTLRVDAPGGSRVAVRVYDLLGRHLGTPVETVARDAETAISVELGGLAPGTYVLRVRAETPEGVQATSHTVQVLR